MLAQGLSSEKIDFCQHLISRLEGERRASVDARALLTYTFRVHRSRDTLSSYRQRSFLTSWTCFAFRLSRHEACRRLCLESECRADYWENFSRNENKISFFRKMEPLSIYEFYPILFPHPKTGPKTNLGGAKSLMDFENFPSEQGKVANLIRQ
ncbi:hypothetical protein TNCT_77271 [Trichonephila clavata]|uniref:Uncharacterized protein n=1 Tax=Trichonephila clavata TaxID=2740835 RepID=A0A8X6ISK3_TRICU|nr:hypothetical protein TNCT_77271 [Trichonephila clavata]